MSKCWPCSFLPEFRRNFGIFVPSSCLWHCLSPHPLACSRLPLRCPLFDRGSLRTLNEASAHAAQPLSYSLRQKRAALPSIEGAREPNFTQDRHEGRVSRPLSSPPWRIQASNRRARPFRKKERDSWLFSKSSAWGTGTGAAGMAMNNLQRVLAKLSR